MFGKGERESVERLKVSDDMRSQMSMPHAKLQHSNQRSTIIDKRRRAQIAAEERRMIDAKRKEKEK